MKNNRVLECRCKTCRQTWTTILVKDAANAAIALVMIAATWVVSKAVRENRAEAS